MSIKLITFSLLLSLFWGCKRDHYCHCGSPRIDSTPHVIHDTKKNAEEKCKKEDETFMPNCEDCGCGIVK